MTVPPNDQAYERALSALYEALALGGVGVISEAVRDAELRALRALMQRYPAEAEQYVAEVRGMRRGGRGGAKNYIDHTDLTGDAGGGG
jgi:hypothetical protein